MSAWAKTTGGRCAQCSKVTTGRKRRFCDESCRLQFQRDVKKREYASGIQEKPCVECGLAFRGSVKSKRCRECIGKSRVKNWCTCEWCGETFVKGNSSRNAGRFCGRKHAFASMRFKKAIKESQRTFQQSLRKAKNEKECDVCGRLFRSSYNSAVCCSAKCLKERTKRRFLDQYQPIPLGDCKGCGVPLDGSSGRHRCHACRRNRHAEHRRAAKAIRRARKRGTKTEVFQPSDVFTRDAYRCGICGKRCNPKACVPHPRAPTLDHIIPLANGGEHTMQNTQCACFICNSIKSDAAGGQLRLFG